MNPNFENDLLMNGAIWAAVLQGLGFPLGQFVVDGTAVMICAAVIPNGLVSLLTIVDVGVSVNGDARVGDRPEERRRGNKMKKGLEIIVV
jgi:hypothetical protein